MARKRGVARADVVDAAASIADAAGFDRVTLAAVAHRVGIRPPSLFAHVDSLAGLRRLLALRAADELAGALENATLGLTGVEALRALAHEYRRFAVRRPGLYDAAQHAVRPQEDEELYRALGRVIVPAIRALAEAGVGPMDRVHITRALRSALHGFVALERSSGFGMPEDVGESFERLVELLLSGVRTVADSS